MSVNAPQPSAPTGPVTPEANLYQHLELTSTLAQAQTALASECALALSFNGRNHAVMMVSPNDLEDFVLGFSLSCGAVEAIDEIYDLRLSEAGEALQADIQISSRAFWNLKQQRRQLAGASGCGLCGVAALEQALPQLPRLSAQPLPAAEHLHGLRARIEAAQYQARSSGALHAALYIDECGSLALCREDIGRHNALDKLIGALKRDKFDCARGFAVVTSRCSLELLHKAVRAGVATLVSLSAPTALTVDWARRHGLNLIHLPHHSAPRVYSPAPAEADQP